MKIFGVIVSLGVAIASAIFTLPNVILVGALFGVGFVLVTIGTTPIDASPSAASVWRVNVVPATKYNYDYYSQHHHTSVVEGQISVRLVRNKEVHSLGTVKIGDPKFDEQVAELTKLGEERATTLNALDAEYS